VVRLSGEDVECGVVDEDEDVWTEVQREEKSTGIRIRMRPKKKRLCPVKTGKSQLPLLCSQGVNCLTPSVPRFRGS